MIDTGRHSLLAALIAVSGLFYGCSGDQISSDGSSPPGYPSSELSVSSINATATDGRVVVSWNKEAGVSYNLYWRQTSPVTKASNDGSFTNITASFFNHTGLTNDVPYYYVMTKVINMAESIESPELSVIPTIPVGAGYSVSGTIKYEDKKYDIEGFTNYTALVNYFKAVRYATVELVTSGGVIATGFTNSSGVISFSNIMSDVSSVYLRVFSETSATGSPPVVVKHPTPYPPAIYAAGAANFSPQAGSSTTSVISIPASSPVAGAFNILDVLTYSGEFIKNYEGTAPSLLNAYWYSGSGNGTWFCDAGGSPDGQCPRGKGIYLLGGDGMGGGDTDEYDDDVIIHEYGHFAAATYSRDDSPGGVHSPYDLEADLRLTWSEGWATFLVGAVKIWLSSSKPELLSSSKITPLSQYVDTEDAAAGFKYDIANPANLGTIKYASNEVAVANILFKTMSGTFSGMSTVWLVFSDYVPNNYSFSLPVNLEAFWEGWLTYETPASVDYNAFLANFTSMSVDYRPDSFEPDEVLAPLRVITAGEVHTLYKSYSSSVADVDYAAINANKGQSYTVKTGNLMNGADTFLKLLDPLGGILKTNDNYNNNADYSSCGTCPANNGTNLSSEISFSAYTTATFFVEVSASADRPDSAGRYGSYKLFVTTP